MNRENLLQEMENLWDIEILWLWGQLYKGKKKVEEAERADSK